jgi:8-oxo-dGTP diphosphatase
MPLMFNFVVNVQVAVVRDGKYLFIVRGGGVNFLPGLKGLPGGKTEHSELADRVLEEAGLREVDEETGVRVAPDLIYVRSSSFSANGKYVVNVVFMGEWESGEPYVKSSGEVVGCMWLSAEDVAADDSIPGWEQLHVQQAERLRRQLGW